jgi:hypothetical protein
MNVALLNNYEIDIESLGMELEERGHQRHEVIKQLNNRYRRFSQKGDFQCVCCNERVEMVLSNDKAFYFRHFDKERCSYSENHKTYTSQKESLEDVPKHRVGRSILRTYLVGTCKASDIRITDGYRFKSTLSYVPDFILEFPNGQRWAIDYLTGLKNDRKYANSLNKRRHTYIQHHFTPIFLFDSYWLAYEPDINHVSLVEGELLCVNQTNQDHLWTDFIRGLDLKLKNVLLNDRPFNFQVKSMPYFAPYERKINIIRFLQENDNPKKTRTVYKPIQVPLEQALTINYEKSDFIYTKENEDCYREEFKRQLELIHQRQENLRKQLELERAIKEKEESKRREFIKAQEEERKKSAYRNAEENYGSTPTVPFIGRSQQQMDSDLKRDLGYLQRKDSSKNSYWHKQVIQHMKEYFGVEGEDVEEKEGQNLEKAPVSEKAASKETSEQKHHLEKQDTIASSLPNWKVEEILNHYVNGEAYFIGDQRKWKEVVLNCFELIYHNKISTSQLLQKIKEQGIEFIQPEKIMSYPIKEYIQFIRKKIKKDISYKK